MDRKIMSKVLATMLAFILTFANVILLGIYTQEAYAASAELETQDTAVSKANIEFDAYFLEEGEKKHSRNVDLVNNKDMLYLSIKVAEGYLSNGIVKLEDTNFRILQDEEQTLEFIQSIDQETNTITLNKIEKGESVVLEIPIQMNTDSNFAVENLEKIAKVTLEGTFVNVKGKEVKVSKTIEVSTAISAKEITSNLDGEVSKYVQFDVNGKKGTILQTVITSNVQNNILPIKQTELEIEVPEINGEAPTTVVLSTISTKSTDGKDGRVFVKDEDYKYENGKITLVIKNEEREDRTISWKKDSKDEIVVTYVYGEKAITKLANVKLQANSKLSLYNNVETISANLEKPMTLQEKVGDIVSFDMQINEQKLEKGQMLVAEAENTKYTENWSANIGYRELVSSLVLEGQAKYVDDKENKYTSIPVYTYTKISSENFLSMFGEEGYIKILDKDGNEITTLNKDNLEYRYEKETTYIKLETSKPLTEGILKVENGREIKPLEYDKTQMQMFGKMNMLVSGEVKYEGQTIVRGEASKDITLAEPKTVLDTSISKKNLSTVETNEKLEMKLVLNTADYSKNLYKNPKIIIEFPSYVENVSEGKIGLLYDKELKLGKTIMSRNEKGNIFIEVPITGEQTEFNTSAVSNGATIIIYANVKVNELAPNITDNIKVYVSNENASTYEAEENGMGVYNIPVKYATQNTIITRNTISGYNGNEEVKALNKAKTAEIKPNSAAKNATVKLDMVNSTSKDITDVMILGRTPFAGNKTVVSGKDLNSKFTANMISEISSTYGIDKKDITIYYSEAENATNDLNNTQNGWTKTPSDLAKVKSYLIVLNNYTVKYGARLSFEYNVQIPANIGGELGTYSTFAVYYKEIIDTDVKEVAKADNTSYPYVATVMSYAAPEVSNAVQAIEAEPVGLVTEKVEEKPADEPVTEPIEETPAGNMEAFSKDDLKISVKRSVSGNEITNDTVVKEGQYVEYNVDLFNNSDKAMTFDVVVSKQNGTFRVLNFVDIATDGVTRLHSYEEIEDETITRRVTVEPKNLQTINYSLLVNDNTQDQFLINTISIMQNGNKVMDDITTQNTIDEGKLKLRLEYNRHEESNIYGGLTTDFVVEATNIADTDLSNVEVTLDLPELLTFKEYNIYELGSDYDSYEKKGNTAVFKINNLKVGETAKIYVLTSVDNIALFEAHEDISIIARAKVSNENYASNVIKKTVNQGQTAIRATMSGSVLDQYVENGQEIIYTIDIENYGLLDELSLSVRDTLPKGIKADSYTLIDSEGNETTEKLKYNVISLTGLKIEAGKKITIKIKTSVNQDLVKDIYLRNTATITGNNIEEVETNSVTYILRRQEIERPRPDNPSDPELPDGPDIPTDPENPENPDDPNNPSNETFEISGMVWNDLNADGRKNSDEKGIAGIEVMLMNNQKSEFVKDSKGNVMTVKTDVNGNYSFAGLASGEYIVVFLYDTNLYNITTYQKSGVNSMENSDAIETTIKINGTDRKVAATDIITVGQASRQNIYLGLVASKKFDFRLDKKVSTVVVQNSAETRTYTFKNDKLAKVEIPSKNMPGSTLTVEYKISVTNEGDVDGTVASIVDYLPKDLNFSAEINPEWYVGTDGNLYTSEFANTVIKPGETKEISLVLTKVIKEAAAEIINNTAEIAESHNTLGLEDIDSTAKNNAEKEDDMSEANLIIAIKTGALTYTLIILGVGMLIAVLAGGIYLIKRKVIVTKI